MNDWKNQKGKPRSRPFEERFWEKVDIPHGGAGCWEWQGAKKKAGYGNIGKDGVTVIAHRAAWGMVHGDPPEGLCVLHRCDNPSCVKPSHLFLGTHKDNSDDKIAKCRQPEMAGFPEEAHPLTTLTSKDVRNMRSLMAMGISAKRVAELYGVSRTSVSAIRTGQNWNRIAKSDGLQHILGSRSYA